MLDPRFEFQYFKILICKLVAIANEDLNKNKICSQIIDSATKIG